MKRWPPFKTVAKEIKPIRALLKTADLPAAEIGQRSGIALSMLDRVIIMSAA